MHRRYDLPSFGLARRGTRCHGPAGDVFRVRVAAAAKVSPGPDEKGRAPGSKPGARCPGFLPQLGLPTERWAFTRE